MTLSPRTLALYMAFAFALTFVGLPVGMAVQDGRIETQIGER